MKLTGTTEEQVRQARLKHRHPPRVQARRHLRRRVRGADALPLQHLRDRLRGAGGRRRDDRKRGAPDHQEEDRHPRRWPEPHRPGDRVRLLLRPRRAGAARGRLRDHHGQLQPGDGVDRLRHVGPAVLRAADPRGRARDHRRGEARGRHRPVRRPDAAAPGGAAHERGRHPARHQRRRDRPGRGPPAVRRAAQEAGPARAGLGDRARARGGVRDRAPDRLPGHGAAVATSSADGRWRSSTTSPASSTSS